MTALLIVLLILSAITMCTPRGAQAREEIRDTARTAGWAAVAPAGRHLLRHALLLLVEALHMLLGAVAFVGGVLALAANRLDTAGAGKAAA